MSHTVVEKNSHVVEKRDIRAYKELHILEIKYPNVACAIRFLLAAHIQSAKMSSNI